ARPCSHARPSGPMRRISVSATRAIRHPAFMPLEGQVNLVAEREPGASLFYNFLEPGSWFGQGNCLDREPFLLDAVAPHRTVVLHFPLPEFDAVLEQHPAYYRCWALILSEAWRTTLGQYLDAKTFEARRRVNQELLTLATRVGQPCGDG